MLAPGAADLISSQPSCMSVDPLEYIELLADVDFVMKAGTI